MFHPNLSTNFKISTESPDFPWQGSLAATVTEFWSALIIKGRFPVIAEITHTLAVNTRRQFFFVVITTASTRCLFENFQLICIYVKS